MQVKKIEKKNEGKFITRYDITYLLDNGEEKVYEIISRDKNITDISQLRKEAPDSVVLIMENETGEKILLNREFRMSIGEWIYNFPAGLIDPGESPAVAAARELREETGLELKEIKDEIDGGYSAIGFSNELTVCFVGVAAGEFKESTSFEEEIEAGWYTRAEVRELLKTAKFAARTQAYCYAWSRE
ncbi:MAG: NUDIX hydrolase [Firmicutes bacterium]|nr:NUDIX hydrolase [Bacillota bacterium]MBR3375075.1 NUDIX hydrolase [Bacillota bacterium]